MSRRVLVDDLIDAHDVAEILGLSHRNTVSKYQVRYPDMPRPVVELGRGRPMLWLRSEIERWHVKTAAQGRTQLGRRPSRPQPRAGRGPIADLESGC
jgi:predicted DNA-binding transcriptional regulator AlpA